MGFEGRQLGRYAISRLIGRGGAGDVYLAEDQRIARQVALKIVQSEGSGLEDTREAARLFEREARTIARLNHPHILPLYDFGEEHIDGTAITYLVTPFCPEGSLITWLRSRHQPPIFSPQELILLMQQAADALGYAHELGIVHRDVKPSNFLVRSRKASPGSPDLLLADFGIARITHGTVNTSQTIRGTPAYMSPEQWRGDSGPETDQYSLAVMAYELLTGRQPFQGTHQQMMYHHCLTQPLPPSSIHPLLSQELDTVILRAMAKQPGERFPTLAAFASAFADAAQKDAVAKKRQQPPRDDVTTLTSSRHAPRESTIQAEHQREIPKTPAALPATSSDIHTTLAISTTDATNGIKRAIHLPNGQVIALQVPPGAYDGQKFYLEQQVEATHPSGQKKNLVVDLAVIPSSDQAVVIPIPGVRPSPFRSRKLLSLALVFAILAASMIGFFSFGTTIITNTGAQATAVASKATLQALDTASLAATTTAGEKATTTTADTATATVAYNPYTSHQTNLSLYELPDKNSPAQWDELHGICTFASDGYHVTNTSQALPGHICIAQHTDLSNVSFEVQMTFLQGKGGGIALSTTNANSYDLYLHSDRTYSLLSCSTGVCKTLLSGYSSWITPGEKQTNIVALVFDTNFINIYINKYFIDATKGNPLPHARIGLIAAAQSEVVFSAVKVWTA